MTITVIVLAAAAAAVVFLWYLPSRGGGSADSDLAARNLVRQAMTTLEQAYVDILTFEPVTMTPEALSALDPTVAYHPMADDSAAKAPTASAAARAVNYAGTATTFAVGTISESGTAYGATVDKGGADKITYYVDGQSVQDWNETTGSTVTTTPTQQTPATAGPTSATDLAAQSLIRSAMSAVETTFFELATFDSTVMTPAVLTAMEPSLTFNVARDATAATAPTSLALNNAVDFYGTTMSYALGTRSESGTTFGVMVSIDLATGRTTTFYVNGGAQDWGSAQASTSATADGATTADSTSTPSTPTVATAPAIMGLHQDTALGCSFEYPASWVEYRADLLNDAARNLQSTYAVADPLGGRVGSTPANYIMFAGERVQGGALPAPRTKLESLASSLAQTSLAGATTLEPTADFEVNGASAAAKSYRVQGTAGQMVWRMACVVSGERVFYFFFVSEEREWSGNKVIFDAALDSFDTTAIG